MASNDDVFYFIAYPKGDTSKVTVIDLSYAVSYERGDWATVNDKDFTEHTDAIEHCRALAAKYNLEYVPFDSRYNEELSEPSYPQLTLP